MALNNINFVGRLAKDPDLRYTQNGQAVVRTSIAVARNYKDNDGNTPADFIPIVIWGARPDSNSNYCSAQNFADNVAIGDMLSFAGRLESGSYETDDGMRYTLDVNVTEYGYIMKKQNSENQQNYGNNNNNNNNNNNSNNNRGNNNNNRSNNRSNNNNNRSNSRGNRN